jgi:hypothetical protein
LSQAAGGGGTIGGSITDNQIAVGATTADDIEGSAGLTWDAAIMQISTVGGNQLDLHDNNSTGAAAATSIIFTDQLDATLGTIGILPVVDVMTMTGTAIIIDANSGAGTIDLSGDVDVLGGNNFRVSDSGDDDFLQIVHSGTLVTISTAGTGAGGVPVRFDLLSGDYVEIGGGGVTSIPLRISDGDSSDYIEISCDATDIQVAVTGGGEIDWQDNIMREMVIKDYGIASASEVVSANAFTITYSEGPAFQVDLEAATAAVTGTISGGPTSGDYGQITVKVEQDSSTAQTLTWAGGTMKWPGGVAHPVTTTVGGFTIYTFETWDGGTIWHGAGADYS